MSSTTEQRIRAKKRLLLATLRKTGRYSVDLCQQAEVAAALAVKIQDYRAVMRGPDYSPIVIETSREGHSRAHVNDMERLYLQYLEQYQMALRALGMNIDAKERKDSGGDAFDDFMARMQEQ